MLCDIWQFLSFDYEFPSLEKRDQGRFSGLLDHQFFHSPAILRTRHSGLHARLYHARISSPVQKRTCFCFFK
jgi:hypothetical protein